MNYINDKLKTLCSDFVELSTKIDEVEKVQSYFLDNDSLLVNELDSLKDTLRIDYLELVHTYKVITEYMKIYHSDLFDSDYFEECEGCHGCSCNK